MRNIIVTLTLLFFIACSLASAADYPHISFQGLLTDAAGDPLPDGTYTVTFTIYDAKVGGTNIWSEIELVTTENGFFSAALGEDGYYLPFAIFENFGNRYLGIQVESDPEITPRTLLMSSPYAYKTYSVDKAFGGLIHNNLTVGAGSNDNSGLNGFVVGAGNINAGSHSSIGGGENSEVSGDHAIIGGGFGNSASQSFATVGGGEDNSALAPWACVPGGRGNIAGGNYSLTAGRKAFATFAGCFVWGDSTDASFNATGPNQFLVRAGGGVGINTASPNGAMHIKSEEGSGNVILYLEMERHWAFKQYSSGSSTALQLESQTANKDFLITTSGAVGISTLSPSEKLHVGGNICYTGTIGACSDERYKTDISTLNNALERVMKLRGVNYRWRIDDFPDKGFEEGNQIGFIAQEIEPLFPEVVMTDKQGYKSVDYGRLTPALVEAIKDLKKENDSMKSELSEIKELLESLLSDQTQASR